jgi:hypothetical protein
VPYTDACLDIPSAESLSTADFSHTYSNSFSMASAGCSPEAGHYHNANDSRGGKVETHIQSNLKDLANGLALPSIVIKGGRSGESFLLGWDMRGGRGGRKLSYRSWGSGLRFRRSRWRRGRGRGNRGRVRRGRGRCLQLCQPFHSDLGEHQSATLHEGTRHVHGRHHWWDQSTTGSSS